MSVISDVRTFWDEDAATYDRSDSHDPTDPIERAAWLRAVEELLPPARATVLDVGAGTGFLSLAAASLGHAVTALDLSSEMLAELSQKAAAAGAEVELCEADADHAPAGPFDAVIERHVLWTLPDPVAALSSWRLAVPSGRLVLFESLWGRGAGALGALRATVREQANRLRSTPPEHHGSYSDEVKEALPFGAGPSAQELLGAVERAGWRAARIVRLRDVEWARNKRLPLPERALGGPPWLAIVARSAPD